MRELALKVAKRALSLFCDPKEASIISEPCNFVWWYVGNLSLVASSRLPLLELHSYTALWVWVTAQINVGRLCAYWITIDVSHGLLWNLFMEQVEIQISYYKHSPISLIYFMETWKPTRKIAEFSVLRYGHLSAHQSMFELFAVLNSVYLTRP